MTVTSDNICHQKQMSSMIPENKELITSCPFACRGHMMATIYDGPNYHTTIDCLECRVCGGAWKWDNLNFQLREPDDGAGE